MKKNNSAHHSETKNRLKSSKKPGLIPVTLVYTGEQHVEAVKIKVTDFDETVEHQEITSLAQLPPPTAGKRRLHISRLMDIYLSHVSHRMNEEMKVLTIMSSFLSTWSCSILPSRPISESICIAFGDYMQQQS